LITASSSIGVVVEPVDQAQQICLTGSRVELVLVGIHARLGGLLALAAHVNLAGRIFPHQDYRESGRQRMILLENCNLARDFAAQVSRKCFAVDDCGQI
jgi:hypothetical protein